MTKLIAFRNFVNTPKNCYISACIYTLFKNFIKSRLHCLIENCCIVLVRCFKKGILITFGKLHYKQSSATRIKCLAQLHYTYWHVTSRGPKRIFLLVVDEYGYACGPKTILYLLVVDEHEYDLFCHDG